MKILAEGLCEAQQWEDRMHWEIKEHLGRRTKRDWGHSFWQSWTLPFYLTGAVCCYHKVTLHSDFILESSEECAKIWMPRNADLIELKWMIYFVKLKKIFPGDSIWHLDWKSEKVGKFHLFIMILYISLYMCTFVFMSEFRCTDVCGRTVYLYMKAKGCHWVSTITLYSMFWGRVSYWAQRSLIG